MTLKLIGCSSHLIIGMVYQLILFGLLCSCANNPNSRLMLMHIYVLSREFQNVKHGRDSKHPCPVPGFLSVCPTLVLWVRHHPLPTNSPGAHPLALEYSWTLLPSSAWHRLHLPDFPKPFPLSKSGSRLTFPMVSPVAPAHRELLPGPPR